MIFASNNAGKLKEIRKILSDYKIYSLKDKNIDIEVEESHSGINHCSNHRTEFGFMVELLTIPIHKVIDIGKNDI